MKCEDEIDCAERRLLVCSWIGIFTTALLITYTICRW